MSDQRFKHVVKDIWNVWKGKPVLAGEVSNTHYFTRGELEVSLYGVGGVHVTLQESTDMGDSWHDVKTTDVELPSPYQECCGLICVKTNFDTQYRLRSNDSNTYTATAILDDVYVGSKTQTEEE